MIAASAAAAETITIAISNVPKCKDESCGPSGVQSPIRFGATLLRPMR